MAEESVLRGIISFFVELGVYDVILPFILVFAIVFAILEKTKIFGVEKIDGDDYTKKNINAMVAFVISFLVIASGKLVGILNKALGNIVILLMVVVSFLILIGSFFSNDENVFLEKGPWRTSFMVAALIGVTLIFLNAVPTGDDSNWLEWGWNNLDTKWAGAIILIVIVIAFMSFIIYEPNKKANHGNGGD